ncbi:cadherin domain-containing protein [Pseudorhodoplanes sp.]|uniref:cadherin domain-containing protein n=1 Tax=Pseudorhodoplanes sp. TaxID=1934341 RepID=UPI003918DF79
MTAANAGDTIMVAPGTYTGNVIINKSLTLLSTDGSGTTVIEGSATGGGLGTIMITPGVNNVTIGDAGQGFHIVGYDVATHSIEHAAIYLQGAHSDITIRGNNVEANGEAGLLSEYNATLSNIVVDQNEFSGVTFFDPPNVRVNGDTENAPRPLVFLGTNDGINGIANNIQFTDNLVTGTAGGFTSGGAQAGNVLVNIDATDAVITGNTFTGFTHQGMPQLRAREENPTIENNDFSNANGGTTGLLVLDDGVPGTVANNDVTGAVIVTTPAGTEMGFGSIQAAVNAAPAGSTLTIAPGIYTEQVVITKNLTLIGAGEDTIITAPAGIIDAINAGAGSRASIITVTNGATVTIQDLLVDGEGRGDELEAGATDFHGIAFINAGGTVDNVTVIGIRMPLDVNGNVSGIQQGRAIYANNADSASRSLAITNSTVEDFQKNAIDLRGAGLDVIVSGNTITGNGATPTTAQNGIVLGVSGEVTGSVTDNIISEIGYTGPASAVSSGILSYGSDVTIADNTLTAPTPDVGETLKAAGIYVLNDDSGSDVQGNSIAGFTSGIVSDGDGGQPILDNNTFSGNGANLQVVNPQVAVNLVGTDDADSLSGGAFNDTITGNGGDDTIDGNGGVDTVVYSDILDASDFSYGGGTWTVTTASQGTDTLTDIEIVDHGGANNILLVGGGGFASIQAAIDAASDGDTILIAEGSYGAFTVNVDNLTIVAVGDVTIQGTFRTDNAITGETKDFFTTAASYSNAAGVGVTIAADGLTLEGITINSFYRGVSFGDGVDNTLIKNVDISDGVAGYYKQQEADVSNLTIQGGTISQVYLGTDFTKTPTSGDGLLTGLTIDGTTFEHITQKGIYIETLTNGLITGVVMTDVGQYGGGPAFGADGLHGGGIDINLKYEEDYQNIIIEDFTMTDVGLSNGLGTPHGNAAAIAVKARDDAPSYSSNPAEFDGVLIIRDGTINGTSTGIRAGENGKSVAGPAVDIQNVTITNAALVEVDNDTLSSVTFGDGAGNDIHVGNVALTDAVTYADTLQASDFSYSGGTWSVNTATEGDDTLSDIEIVEHGGAGRFLLVGNGGFDTIQAAVNAAASGDTIMVAPGAYAEAVTIPAGKTGLTILGANYGVGHDGSRGAESSLDGGFIVFGDGATIDGFEITEGTLIFGETAGVYVQAANVTITNSILERSGPVDGDGSRGVINAVGNGDGLTVTNNQMSGWATGVYVQGADNVTVSGNALTGNYVGMSADAYPGDNDNLQVTDNTFDNVLEDLGIGGVGGTSNGSIDGNSFTKGIFDYDPADNDALIGENTIDKPVVVTVPGTSTQMGFDTIQEAIDAAPAGAVVTIAAGVYPENLVITRGITLVGVGTVTIEPADGEPVTISGDLGGDDVTLQNLDIVGNTGDYGVYVADNANVGTLTLTGSSISGAGSYALFVHNEDLNTTPSAAEVVVTDTTFANNGYDGATGAAHIKLFGFTGDATIQNVTIEGGSGGFAPANLPNLPEYGIEITGVPNVHLATVPPTPPMGQVSIDNVTITGQFEKNTVAIWNFGDIDGLSINGLDLSDTETNWGPVFNIDGVTADYDASVFDIALPSGSIATELQGDKNAQDDTDQTITGTSGNDRIIGKTGNDTLIGGDGDDELFGHDKAGGAAAGDTGNDTLIGGKGNDYLDGGAGIDTAIYSGNWSDYIIIDHGGYFTIEDKRPGEDGIDTVYNVESFEFANATYSAANLLNVAPTDIDLIGGSVVENATNGTVVATLSTVDVNGGDTATYTLLDNAGGRFAISGNQIVVANSGLLDFETATSHSVTVQVTDAGGLTYEETFVISVTDANDVAPNFTSPASFTIAENTTAVGTVAADDLDTVGGPITYAITGGADAALFTINPTTGALSFITAPDFEVASQYHVEVTASDGLNTSVQAITVNVTDENDNAPVLQTTVFSVPENQTLIGNLVAIDPDLTGGSINYSITGGADASLFAINNMTGAISFLAAQDFEGASQQFEVEITVSDGTNSSTETVTINLTDVNDNAPVITSSATFTVSENTTAVGTVTANDVDTTGEPITYSITGGADAALFTINETTGALSFVAAPDFETGPASYSVQVTASDGVNASVPQTITVTVTDENDTAPAFTSPPTFTIAENTTAVGTVVATDLDTVGGPITYSVSGGADAALFTINPTTGALSFIAAPDFETDPLAYEVEITASDGVNSSVQTVTVNITDVNDNAPVITSPATFTVAENTTAVGVVTSSDIDTVGTPNYAITGGADAALFTINSETGALSFVNAPDFETGPLQYEVEVTVSDGAQSSAQTITVDLTDVNDNAPVITSSATFTVSENTTAVGTVTANDVDTTGEPITYSITGGADAALFTINETTGALSFVAAPDFETGPASYSVQVTASDGVNASVPQTITVTVTDENDTAPAFTSPPTFTIAENTTAVGTVVATDLDTVGGPITYSVSGGADAALFTINPTTGALAFIVAPDFEAASQYNVEVTASDGVNTSVQAITVNLTDVNDTAPVIVTTSLSVAEGSTIVGAVVANDADTVGGPITYAITGGANQALFTINATTGVLSLVTPQDYELGTTSFEVEVTASDGVNTSAAQTITVNLLDVGPGTPVDVNGAVNQVVEGAAAGTTVGIDVDASDAWPVLPDNAVYSIISDTSNGGFQINPTTGLVTVVDGTKLDYETATQHTIIVQALDRIGGNASTAAFVINLLDVTGNTITGTNKADLITAVSGPGGSTASNVVATSEADIITPGKGVDFVDGLAGDDIIQINGKDNAADTLLGNVGTDTIRVLGTKGVTLNGFDTVLSSIERWEGNGAGIIGSKGNDVFDFSNLDFVSNMGTIDGGNGNDVITGTQFDDVIRGGKGVDTLNGGDGNDTFLLKGKDDAADIIDGGAGIDTVQVSGSVTLNGFHAGNSSIEQWLGTGKGIKGSAGNDVFDFSALTSVVNMGIVDAGAGDDTVIGSSFADILRGGVGNDRLDGGAGNDILTGGAGSDTFVYATGYGHDTVTDYAAGQDIFDLTGTGVADFAALQMTDTAQGVVITFGIDDTLTINKATIALLTANQGDFLFA